MEATQFSYHRSDGSSQTLSLADLMRRRDVLEVGYHPNDCPEARWGAPQDSDEAKTCEQRVGEANKRRMEAHRKWFKAGYGCE